MTSDRQADYVLAAVAALGPHDVSRRHADSLRRRCQAQLQTRPTRTVVSRGVDRTALQRFIGPALGSAWCLAYLVEVIRRAVAAYGF